MPQKLFIKDYKRDEAGRPIKDPKTGKFIQESKEIYIIRSWSKQNGTQIYLHANGVYGYKDGSPVKSRKELEDPDLIGSKIQRDRALAWWDRKGESYSKEFYEKRERMLAEIEDETPVTEKISELDAALYMRRAVSAKGGASKKYSEPSTWFEWFDERPPWWGLLDIAQDAEYYYKKVDPALATLEEEMEKIAANS
jgi:hypothetical protein